MPLARYLGLTLWILGLRISNVYEPIDCQAWNYAVLMVAYGSAASSSMLLLLRVSALSSRNPYMIGFLAAFYASLWATTIWGVYNSDATYLEEFHLCVATNSSSSHRIMTAMWFAFDFTCLFLMMFLFLRAHRAYRGTLWAFMLQQGIAYAITITAAYLFVVVIMCLKLNDAITHTANAYTLIATILCATRMHRALVLYCEPSSPAGNTAAHVPTVDMVSAGRGEFPNPRGRPQPLNISVSVTVDKEDNERSTDHQSDDYAMKTFDITRRDDSHLGQV